MTDRDAFICAIIAEPDDDVARLVFADWLDEHGEPERAEFIRLQIAHALCQDESDARIEPTSRQTELEARCGPDWLGEWPTPYGVRLDRFHRGFVHHVRFADLKSFRRHARTVAATIPAHSMMFDLVQSNTAQALADLPELGHIRNLNWPTTMADSPSLVRLFASPHLAALRRLWFHQQSTSPEVMVAIASQRVGLQTLQARNIGLDDSAITAFAVSARLPHLRELWLSSNRIGDAGAAALASSRGLPGLRVLRVAKNEIGASGAGALAVSANLGGLHRLDLRDNPVGPDVVAQLRERFGDRVLLSELRDER